MRPSDQGSPDDPQAFKWLQAQGFAPERLAIAGDSAGGGLTAATRIARDSALRGPEHYTIGLFGDMPYGAQGRADLAVPEVVAADTAGADVGDGVPVLLMSRLPGRALASPDEQALATALVAVHAVDGRGFAHTYFPWCRQTSTAPPRGCRRPDVWARALALWREHEPAYEPRFVHRDFHPGNVLWSRGRLSGVVDWANACVGPVGIDVATCRWNLHAWAGAEVADAFVRAYEQVAGCAHDSYWDLASILEEDWDLTDDPARVHDAEERLALALSRTG